MGALALAVVALLGCREEAAFPDRPLVLICPWSAGGGTDRVSRGLASLLEEELGVPVNVVNATGGAGVTGHTRGMLARPDGYTMTLMTAELNMLHWRGLTSVTYRDYEPLMLVNRDDAAVLVRNDAPWKTLNDLEHAIREGPGPLKASGTAHGGIWHVALAGWLEAVELRSRDVIWISINGAAPSLQELMAGGLDLVCCSLPEAQSLLDAHEIRCLGVMAAKRLPAFPEVATFREQGVDWSLGTWRGLGLPKGVPEMRFERLAQAVERVVTGDAYLDFMRTAGFNAAAEPPGQFGQTLATLDEQFGAILTSEAFRGGQTGRLGPMAFPVLLALLLGCTVVAMIASGNLGLSDTAGPLTGRGLARVGLVVAFVIVYALVAERAGYLLTAAPLLFLLLQRLRVRWYLALAVSILLTLATYQAFAVYLRVPLPLGAWWGS